MVYFIIIIIDYISKLLDELVDVGLATKYTLRLLDQVKEELGGFKVNCETCHLGIVLLRFLLILLCRLCLDSHRFIEVVTCADRQVIASKRQTKRLNVA